MFHDGFVCICEEQDNNYNPSVLSVYMGLGLIDKVRLDEFNLEQIQSNLTIRSSLLSSHMY